MSSEEDHGKVDASATADPSQNTVRFEIKKWNAVTMWSWDICADTCAICRNSLNEPSIEYQVLGICRIYFIPMVFSISNTPPFLELLERSYDRLSKQLDSIIIILTFHSV